MNFYNENDSFPAARLRERARIGLVPHGVVDERSIADLRPEDLNGFTQAHFFAGTGGWPYALRLAGWPDDAPVWTGSCPCQPFSVAGKRRGASDDRHLWPAWFRLIRECRPVCCFGEQVDSKDGRAWLDAVCADLEGAGYAVGAAFLPAASVGAPHGRPRIFFGAHTIGERDDDTGRRAAGAAPAGVRAPAREQWLRADARLGGTDGGARPDARHTERRPPDAGRNDDLGQDARGPQGSGRAGEYRGSRIYGPDADERAGRQGRALNAGRDHRSDAGEGAGPCGGGRTGLAEQQRLEGLAWHGDRERGPGWLSSIEARSLAEAGATRGFWGDCDWWLGRDGKARPIGPGIFPLAHGVPARVGKLREWGNAIVPQVAAEFVMAFCEARALVREQDGGK